MTKRRTLAYGYLRIPYDMDDATIRELEHTVTDQAEELGFDFGAFFHEFDTGSYTGFDELITELQRADAHTVLVPSLDHLSPHPLLRTCLLSLLERDATAEVLDAVRGERLDGSAEKSP